jgi:hypothetical protein
MPQFLYVFRGGAPGSPEEMQQHMQRWIAWMNGLVDSGRVKQRGAPLDRKTGRVVRGPMITDGPYAEKDVVAGYLVIEAADYDEAARLSQGCPIFNFGGAIEIRELLMSGAPGRMPEPG